MGFLESIAADAIACSAYAPRNWLLVTPKTRSPTTKPETSGPTLKTSPARSDPSVSGRGWGNALLPALIHASHGPTPAARTLTRTSPGPGRGLGIVSQIIFSGGPNSCTRQAFVEDSSDF